MDWNEYLSYGLDDLDEDDPEVFDSVYYKEVPYDSKTLSETLIVTYSPKYKNYQRSIREGQIERARKMMTESGKPQKNRKIQTILPVS